MLLAKNRICMCKSVRLLCHGHPSIIPLYSWVRVGQTIGDCYVAHATPQECVIVPPTEVTCEEYIDHKTEELKHNILVRLTFPTGIKEVYIYPKRTWNEVTRRFIKPLTAGRPPKEQGAVLYGPPGTGKTSMVLILSRILGLHPVVLNPSVILSKYLGEAEKNLASKLREAEMHEPSVLVMDDAEWLVSGRKLQGTAEESRAYTAMLQILFEALQRWYHSRRSIIGLVTTNVSTSRIDRALRRSGRLGKPIFFPLPDFEAVHTLLVEYGVPPKKAEELAVRIVNSGLPMSDVVSIAKDVLEGLEPSIEPQEESGYLRYVPPMLGHGVKEWLAGAWSKVCMGLKSGTRIWVPIPATIGVHIVAACVGIVCRKPVIILTDYRNADDAVATAKMSDAVIVIDTEIMSNDMIKYIVSKARHTALAFVGKSRPEVPALPIPVDYVSTFKARHALLKLLAKVFKIQITEKDLNIVKSLSNDAWSMIAEAMGLFKTSPLIVARYVRRR